MEAVTDDEGTSIHEFILVAVCYRGMFSTHFKTLIFSPDNKLLIVSSQTGTVHVFYIGDAIAKKRDLNYVRKNELHSCVHLKNDVLLKNHT